MENEAALLKLGTVFDGILDPAHSYLPDVGWKYPQISAV
jgi:hypothetical protein